MDVAARYQDSLISWRDFEHLDWFGLILIFEVSHQGLTLLSKTCVKAVFGHTVKLYILKLGSVVLLQHNHEHGHAFVISLGQFEGSLFEPTQGSIEIPEGGGHSVDYVHFLQYLGRHHVGSLIHRLEIVTGSSLQWGEHQLLYLLVVMALVDVLSTSPCQTWKDIASSLGESWNIGRTTFRLL